jgi:hypothetical protein
MASKVDNNKPCPQRRGKDNSVLRAGDIMPPYNKKAAPSPKSSDSGLSHAMQKTQGPIEISDVKKQEREIPKFDLAEQILAEQRKVTSIRRKAPDRKADFGELIHAEESAENQFAEAKILSEQQQIIAEIVAKDIKKLLGVL